MIGGKESIDHLNEKISPSAHVETNQSLNL